MPNEITIVVKDSGAETVIADMGRIRTAASELGATKATVGVDAETGAADAKLEETRHLADEVDGKKAEVRTEAETGSTDAKLGETKHEVRELDGKKATISVNANVAGALSRIALVGAALTALSAGAGALGAMSLAGVAAGVAGGGAIAAGFSGIGDAVKALGEKQAAAGGAAGGAARNNLALAGALDQVKTASRQLASAEADAKSQTIASEEAITNAERDVTNAQLNEKQAQTDLTAARSAALVTLQQLNDETADMALRQRDAALRVQETKDALDAANKDRHGTDTTRARAQLEYDTAIQNQKDLADAAQQLAAKKADADRKGVNGSDQVVAAQDRLRQATEAVQQAQQRVNDANRAAADQARHSADQIASAKQGVVDANRAVQSAEQSAAGAAGGGAAAQNALARAMDNLSPAGQRFARFLRGFIDGPLKDLRFAAQEGLLPPIQDELKSLEPFLEKLTPKVKAFSGEIGNMVAWGIEIGSKFVPALLDLATVGLKGLEPLMPVFETVAQDIAGVIQELIKSGEVNVWMKEFVQIVTILASHLPDLILLAADLADELGPQMIPLIAQLLPLFIQLLHVAGPLLAAALHASIPLVKLLIVALQAWGPLLIGMANDIAKFMDWLVKVRRDIRSTMDSIHTFKVNAQQWIRQMIDYIEHLDVWGSITRGAQDMYNKVSGFFGDLGSQVSSFGSSVSSALGSIGLAHGGIVGGAAGGGARSGWHMVGEHGPELVRLPPGTQVHSNPDTARMMAAGGAVSHSLDLRVEDSEVGRFLAEILRKYVRTKGGNVQLVLGVNR